MGGRIRRAVRRTREAAEPLGLTLALIALSVVLVTCSLFIWHLVKWDHLTQSKDEFWLKTWFGLGTIGSLLISMYILRTLRKETITDSIEMLGAFVSLIEDAVVSKQDHLRVSLLHFCPCPGLFDQEFRGNKLFMKFQSLLYQLSGKAGTELCIAMLGPEDREAFLRRFYDGEQSFAEPRVLRELGGENHYVDRAEGFFKIVLTPLEIYKSGGTISKGWFTKALAGEHVIVLGASDQRGFIGTCWFDGRFRYEGQIIRGSATALHSLFDALVKTYVEPPPASTPPDADSVQPVDPHLPIPLPAP